MGIIATGAATTGKALPYVQAGSAASGGLFSFIGAKKRRRHERDIASRAQQHNIDMWKMQAAYNHPTEQMARLKEAGLNPNLIYGEGAAGASGQMSNKPEAVMPNLGEHQIETMSRNIPDMIDLWQRLYTMNLTQRQYRHEHQKKGLTIDRRNLTRLQESNLAQDYSIKYAAKQELIQQLKAQANLTTTRAEREKYLKEISRLEMELSRSLRPYGMHSGDHVAGRILMQILKNFGISIESLLDLPKKLH